MNNNQITTTTTKEDNSTYDLLAAYLEPDFGNIYEYNFTGDDEQTDELRKAIERYFFRDIPADVLDCLFALAEGDERIDPAAKEAHIDNLLERLEPREIAIIVRQAAVVAVPTLHQLIGDVQEWPLAGNEKIDAATWLSAHCGPAEWRELARYSRNPEFMSIVQQLATTSALLPDDLANTLTPPELLAAWKCVVRAVPSDLTDEQWLLLQRHIGPAEEGKWGNVIQSRSWRDLDATRHFLNALRFKMAYDFSWSDLPTRYGATFKIRRLYRDYVTARLFVRLRDALKADSNATDLIAWLDEVIGDPGWKLRHE